MPSFLRPKTKNRPMPSDRELVAMMAALMALNALAIDTMLPAFPTMAGEFGLVNGNDIQSLISFYFLGMGTGALVMGPLSDRFGRRAVMFPAIICYAVISLACSFAPNFEFLLGLRVLQGICGSAMAVLVPAVIRDQFEGDAMARRMSFVIMIFMIVPIIAPIFGSIILYFAPWQMIFNLTAILAICVAFWIWRRLPETLAPENVISIQPRKIGAVWKEIISNRSALGYVFAAGFVQAALVGYLNTSEQMFRETFNAPGFFPIGFAIIAAGMACASFTNGRIVERFGARRVSQSAAIFFIIMGTAQLIAAQTMPQALWLFMIFCTVNIAMIGFTMANFSSIAMQPFGAMAGAASSFQSSLRTIMGAVLGGIIGMQFDGTITPIAFAYCICGMLALGSVFWAERGKLFTRSVAVHKIQI